MDIIWLFKAGFTDISQYSKDLPGAAAGDVAAAAAVAVSTAARTNV